MCEINVSDDAILTSSLVLKMKSGQYSICLIPVALEYMLFVAWLQTLKPFGLQSHLYSLASFPALKINYAQGDTFPPTPIPQVSISFTSYQPIQQLPIRFKNPCIYKYVYDNKVIGIGTEEHTLNYIERVGM